MTMERFVDGDPDRARTKREADRIQNENENRVAELARDSENEDSQK